MIMSNEVISNIRSDNALASILSRFDTHYIVDIIRDSIGMRFRPYESPLPSIYSIESSFIELINKCADNDHKAKVLEVREQTYREIIIEVCEFYNITFNYDTSVDIYSNAFWLYDFFVSNFTEHFITFLVNYIFNNKVHLYQYLNLDNLKKEKDTSSIYSKKITTDPYLSVIHANLGRVLDNIFYFDITLSDIIENSFSAEQKRSQGVCQFLHNTVTDNNGDIFKTKYAVLYNNSYRADIITSVKLEMQRRLMSVEGL